MNSLADFDRATALYLANAKADHKSEQTQENYARRLGFYRAFLEEQGLFPSSPDSVLRWKLFLADKGLAVSSIGAYLRELSIFFAWACSLPELGLGDKNPVEPSLRPEQQNSRPYDLILTEDDILLLLSEQGPKFSRRSAMFNRNRAITVLFLATALRVSELCALRWNNLDFQAGTIAVEHGKGNKFRFVSFPKIAQDALLSWSTGQGEGTDFVFAVGNGHAFTRQQMSELIERHVYAMTGKHGVRCHRLRHAAASFLIEKNIRTEDIQALLGHSSIATTKRYISRLNPLAPAAAVNQAFANL